MFTDADFRELLGFIGQKLSDLRHARHEKMETVARAVGIRQSVMSQIEQGRYEDLGFELLWNLANYYKVELGYIFAR